ncbi:hypothetical protein EVAR_82297_1 [Eumeta japonica]|uniref:Uncharacterized protein n=1 Tax=Eumeta variegata TaxID=151549 RepID=A0A4C1W1D1_EUMVA|nr:hypothetical protein EVAR_82297_1 [Eumeta japonica]
MLHSQLDKFKDNMTAYSDKQGKRIHQVIIEFERRHQGQHSESPVFGIKCLEVTKPTRGITTKTAVRGRRGGRLTLDVHYLPIYGAGDHDSTMTSTFLVSSWRRSPNVVRAVVVTAARARSISARQSAHVTRLNDLIKVPCPSSPAPAAQPAHGNV